MPSFLKCFLLRFHRLIHQVINPVLPSQVYWQQKGQRGEGSGVGEASTITVESTCAAAAYKGQGVGRLEKNPWLSRSHHSFPAVRRLHKGLWRPLQLLGEAYFMAQYQQVLHRLRGGFLPSCKSAYYPAHPLWMGTGVCIRPTLLLAIICITVEPRGNQSGLGHHVLNKWS